ncbi:MAG: DUF4275 family protein [Kofleriaceae bacterium]|nr:DUF4275 family protein [Kofleriaceae bacterium]
MSHASKIHDVLVAGGCAPVELTDKEVWSWQKRWREVFARGLHAATGKWVLHEFDWHVFSYEHHPYVTGDRAWNAYRAIEPCSFIVISAYAHETFGFQCEGKPPERLKRDIDILVAPTTLDWTMAFTHEGHCGPYFAEP